MKNINKQYDNIAKDFAQLSIRRNKDSRKAFRKMIPKNLSGLRVLDLGCGNGYETKEYLKRKAKKVVGLDASVELLKQGKKQYPKIEFHNGLFENIPFLKNSFDYIFSRYALQTAKELDSIWKEAHRVLKPGGVFMFLVTHPIRQMYEKKTTPKNYFTQEIVQSICFEGKLTFIEPTHTLEEYISPFMLNNFTLEVYEEKTDIDAEKIVDTYPAFLILKWRRK